MVESKVLQMFYFDFWCRRWGSLMSSTSRRTQQSLVRVPPGTSRGYCSLMVAPLKTGRTGHPVSSYHTHALTYAHIHRYFISTPCVLCRWWREGRGVSDGWQCSEYPQRDWKTSASHRLQQHPWGGWSQSSQTGHKLTDTNTYSTPPRGQGAAILNLWSQIKRMTGQGWRGPNSRWHHHCEIFKLLYLHESWNDLQTDHQIALMWSLMWH